MKKVIIVFILLITLLLVSCSQQEGSNNEQANEGSFQEKNENLAKNNFDNVSKKTISDLAVNARIINIDAKKWEYSIKEIRVKKWEKVIIKINNIDFDHGMAIPWMKIVWLDEIILDTSKVWVFIFKCANYCGKGHSTMEWKIIIE